MRDEAAKPTRHVRTPRAARRGTDQSVLTPPLGLPPLPGTAGGDPAEAGGVAPATREPPVGARAAARCVCGHPRAAHEHYRSGSDCGVCGVVKCAAFRRTGGLLRRMLRRLRLVR
jgi:hypothetical protein